MEAHKVTNLLGALRGLQETRVATREESGVLGFPSRRGLTPRGLLASVTLFFLLSAPLCTASQSSCLLSSDVPPGFRTISEPFHLFPQLQLSEDLLPF